MVDTTNRLAGARATFGSKKPVAAASTGDISTLSGFQTIDGISFTSTGDNLRVLLKDQTDATQNGIYEQASSTWVRTKDFDGNTDFIKGTPIWVALGGTINGGKAFEVSSDNPPNVGTSSITLKQWVPDKFSSNVEVASANTISLDDVEGDFITITGTTAIITLTAQISTAVPLQQAMVNTVVARADETANSAQATTFAVNCHARVNDDPVGNQG